MGIWNIFLCTVVTAYMIIITQQAITKGAEVFSLSERLELSMRFCAAKNASLDKRHVYGHCMRRWNEKYSKFCKGTSTLGSTACEGLKKKMKNAIEKFTLLMAKSSTEHCDVGQKREKMYDSNFQFCCENHIWKKRYREQIVCCDKLHVNGSKTTCCNSSEIDLPALKRASCCHGNLINEDAEKCDENIPTTNAGHLTTMSLVPDLTFTQYRYTKVAIKHRKTNHKGHPRLHQIDHNDVDSRADSNSMIIVYICAPVVSVMLLVVLVVLIRKVSINKSNNMERLCFLKNKLDNNTYGATAIELCVISANQTHTRKTINQRHPPQTEQRLVTNTNRNPTVPEVAANVTMTEQRNMHFTDLINVEIQTDPRKEINIKNSMGRDFCCSHTFTISNRSLQIPDSAVVLTLSEADVDGKSLKCYASTFRDLRENYSKLNTLISQEEQIVSPAVEYFFPAVTRLQQFACIVMPIGRRGKDFHLWKIKSDQGHGKSTHREEIPMTTNVDITEDKLDAYYEIVEGKIRIYLKTFSWLVCTVCNSDHYGFNLAARIYTRNEPHNEESKQVRVTVYILDGVRQLEDYLKIINEDESTLNLYRNINLPNYVSLEDSLRVRMLLLSESINTWKPLLSEDEEMDEEIAMHTITQCHKSKSNGQPFCIDCHYILLPSGNASTTSVHCKVEFKFTEFDYTKEYCCKGRVVKQKRLGQKICCDTTLPNGTIISCCNTRNISVTSLKTAACCYTVFYDVDTEFCHNSVVHSLLRSTKKIHASNEASLENTVKSESSAYAIYLVIICVILLFVSVAAAFCVSILKTRQQYPSTPYKYPPPKSTLYSVMERKSKTRVNFSFDNAFSSDAIANDIETDGFVEDNDHRLLKQDHRSLHNVVIRDLPNKFLSTTSIESSNKRTQTEEEKEINVRNVMGEEFDCKHVFDKNNKSLVLPNSVVKLTLSEEDVSDGPIDCYASTYRNLKQIYATFESYMGEGEEIVSPTIEYFFPTNKRLSRFACVDMDYYSCSCNSALKVWRYECNPENGKVSMKVEIPNRKNLNDIKNVEVYYENICPGKIRIYLKRFCTLMCSVCNGSHECLSLTAHTYVLTVPCDTESKNVRVSLYILARVNQLADYAYGVNQFVNEEERNVPSKQKKICLPMTVRLEDDLSIEFKLWQESENVWQPRSFNGDLDDSEYVQLHNIVDCPRHSPKGQPYSKEWYFVYSGGSTQIPGQVMFNCSISISMLHPHPGLDTRQPPQNKFAINHVVDLSSIKKPIHNQPPERDMILPSARQFRRSEFPIQESTEPVQMAPDEKKDKNRPEQVERTGVVNRLSPAQFLVKDQVNDRTNDQNELQNYNRQGARPKETKHSRANKLLNPLVQGRRAHEQEEVNRRNAYMSQHNPAEQVVRAETTEDSV